MQKSIGRCPRCHFPVIAVSYPGTHDIRHCRFVQRSPTFTVGENTPGTPLSSTVYPSSAALDPEHTGQPEYQCVKIFPVCVYVVAVVVADETYLLKRVSICVVFDVHVYWRCFQPEI